MTGVIADGLVEADNPAFNADPSGLRDLVLNRAREVQDNRRAEREAAERRAKAEARARILGLARLRDALEPLAGLRTLDGVRTELFVRHPDSGDPLAALRTPCDRVVVRATVLVSEEADGFRVTYDTGSTVLAYSAHQAAEQVAEKLAPHIDPDQ